MTLNVGNGTAEKGAAPAAAEPALSVQISEHTDVSCFAGEDGMAAVNVSGGKPGYTCRWDTTPAHIGRRAVGSAVGTYTVTVTDANGCTVKASVTIAGPSANLVAEVVDQSAASAAGRSDATVTVAAGGERGRISSSWAMVFSSLTTCCAEWRPAFTRSRSKTGTIAVRVCG